ncbi:MAG: hypothetical protein R3E97_12055 [Candidatus Eisenbacteria bacterium]
MPTTSNDHELLVAVARRASVWVTDFLPASDTGDLSHLTQGAGLAVPAEAVDGERLDPAPPPNVNTNVSERDLANQAGARIRGSLVELLRAFPNRNPLAKFYETHLQAVLPHITNRWPAADGMLLSGDPAALATLPLGMPEPFAAARGGSDAAFEHWRRIIERLSGADSTGTPRADEPSDGFDPAEIPSESPFGSSALPELLRTAPDAPSALELLGYHLAAGHLSGYQVLVEALRHTGWTPERLRPEAGPGLEWWGLPTEIARLAQAFVVEREEALDHERRRAEAALEANS